jgi:hypothetical protein
LIRELAAQCPPGKFRQELDEMIFDRKLKEDPDAALAEARANPSPMVAVRQLVKIAGHEIRNNPEKSLTLLDEILRGPHLVDERIFNEKGYSSDPRVVPGLVGVVQELTLKQPETVMKCLQKHGLVNPTSNLFSNARVAWFWHDPEAASRWFDANGFPKK